MNIEDINDDILGETGYIKELTQKGYPQYIEEEAVKAAGAIEKTEDIEMLQQLREGEGLHDIFSSGIGEDLDRLEEADMIERPDTGSEYVRLTRLSQVYLRYYSEIF